LADYEKELNNLKQNLERAKTLKYKAEVRLEQLTQEKEKIIKELKELGVNPEDLDMEIEKLENEINNLFKDANELLPRDILEKM